MASNVLATGDDSVMGRNELLSSSGLLGLRSGTILGQMLGMAVGTPSGPMALKFLDSWIVSLISYSDDYSHSFRVNWRLNLFGIALLFDRWTFSNLIEMLTFFLGLFLLYF